MRSVVAHAGLVLCLTTSACATDGPASRSEAAATDASAEGCTEATTGSRLRRCGAGNAKAVSRGDADRSGPGLKRTGAGSQWPDRRPEPA
jgi:hypothetical protein